MARAIAGKRDEDFPEEWIKILRENALQKAFFILADFYQLSLNQLFHEMYKTTVERRGNAFARGGIIDGSIPERILPNVHRISRSQHEKLLKMVDTGSNQNSGFIISEKVAGRSYPGLKVPVANPDISLKPDEELMKKINETSAKAISDEIDHLAVNFGKKGKS